MKFPVIMGPPEAAFEVRDVTVDRRGTTARAKMVIRSWMCDSRGKLRPGNLGVLVDNVLGYSIIAGAPQGHWAVTTEMSVDVTGSLPTDGCVLHGEAELIGRNATDGYAEALVIDSAGQVVARARQWGHFIPGLPQVGPCTPAGSGFGPHPRHRPPVLLERELTDTDRGLVATLDVESGVANPNGNLHGGVAMAWSDAAAAAALQRNGAAFATTSAHVAYVRPTPAGASLQMIATVSHLGRSLGLVHIVFSLPDGKQCMFATVSAHGI
ncbi:hotdog fold thioesterase [Saccharopolyspora sp. ID03-671]|uniref:PaaI family thioesterase n=1 Tax=Saccharopolyspora sp. ID03-671 TaxID=3073066 RepID=UPI0032458C54